MLQIAVSFSAIVRFPSFEEKQGDSNSVSKEMMSMVDAIFEEITGSALNKTIMVNAPGTQISAATTAII
jgi:hypothetical protein